MKRLAALFGISTILFFVFFSGCVFSERNIRATKLDDEPHNYINITEEQMNNFPHLKEAIITNKAIQTPQQEFQDLDDLLRSEFTSNIKYQNEYYEVFRSQS